VLNEAKVVSFTYSGSTDLTPTFAPYQFSLLPSAEAQGEGMANFAINVLKAKSAAILTDTGAQSKAGTPVIKSVLEKAGVKVTGAADFAYGAEDMTPQLLSLKRGNPDALLIWTATGPDTGRILSGIEQIGWGEIRSSGALTVSMAATVAAKFTTKESFKNVGALVYKGWTYCSGEKPADIPFGKFITRLKAFEPGKFGQLGIPVVAGVYDSVYVFKAAVEGAKSTEGTALKEWLEKPGNLNKIAVVNGEFSASPTNHFMVGASGLTTIVDPLKVTDGVWQRPGC
jgi:branched-chain amino acid transport system substrate-binding protein